MRRDPTEFRERFLRWKNGELVYDKGLAIKHAAVGIDKTYDVGSHPIFDSLVVTPHGATFPSIQNAVKTKLEYDMIKDLGLFDDDDRQDYMWYSMLNNNANPFFTNIVPHYSTGKDATVDKIIAAEGKLLRTPLDIGDGKWTVGTGLTGKEYIAAARAKGTWTDEDNYAAVTKEVNKIRKWLPDTIPTYNLLPKDAQDVLIDIAYNVGLGGISKEKSPKFHAALERGDWKEAARLMDWGNNLLTTDGRPMTGLRTRNANRRKAFLEAMLAQRAATVDRKQQTLQLAPTSFVLDARRWPTTGGAGFVIPYSYKPIQQTKQIEPPKYAPNDYLKRALYYMLQQDF